MFKRILHFFLNQAIRKTYITTYITTPTYVHIQDTLVHIALAIIRSDVRCTRPELIKNDVDDDDIVTYKSKYCHVQIKVLSHTNQYLYKELKIYTVHVGRLIHASLTTTLTDRKKSQFSSCPMQFSCASLVQTSEAARNARQNRICQIYSPAIIGRQHVEQYTCFNMYQLFRRDAALT